MPDHIIIGSFGSPFGIRGWIKINSLTSPRRNILAFKPWLIKKEGGWEQLSFEDSKEQLKSIIVKLSNCNTPEEVSKFTNIKIWIERSQLPKLKNEYYWADLEGLKVINSDDVELGTVEKLLATGANDVLVVMGERKRLIPYISSVITKVDLKKGTIYVDWEKDF